PGPSPREITLLQRKPGCSRRRLGKTTTRIHRLALQRKGDVMRGGVTYEEIVPEGIIVSDGPERADPRLIAADTVVICAGQEPERSLLDALAGRGIPAEVIGGADRAAELDAKRAIDQGSRLAARL
ncbi:MAG: NADPH-dependent 2,4-dienoyl-CoA reductase, partial [Rhodobacteraceae bacterium]|nr:NADPH-dependent 2,4-dienoyl-CoA reductase [Paracoccaceae bacterium]